MYWSYCYDFFPHVQPVPVGLLKGYGGNPSLLVVQVNIIYNSSWDEWSTYLAHDACPPVLLL